MIVGKKFIHKFQETCPLFNCSKFLAVGWGERFSTPNGLPATICCCSVTHEPSLVVDTRKG